MTACNKRAFCFGSGQQQDGDKQKRALPVGKKAEHAHRRPERPSDGLAVQS